MFSRVSVNNGTGFLLANGNLAIPQLDRVYIFECHDEETDELVFSRTEPVEVLDSYYKKVDC